MGGTNFGTMRSWGTPRYCGARQNFGQTPGFDRENVCNVRGGSCTVTPPLSRARKKNTHALGRQEGGGTLSKLDDVSALEKTKCNTGCHRIKIAFFWALVINCIIRYTTILHWDNNIVFLRNNSPQVMKKLFVSIWEQNHNFKKNSFSCWDENNINYF